VSALRDKRVGRYELLIELGRGGMAELFLGRLQGVGGFTKLLAIKRILPHFAEEPQFKELFLNEGRIAAQLTHPHVCQVFELDEADGELFIAMEYLDGVSWEHLGAVVPRELALPLTVGVMMQAAEGLHYAHSQHVIHRDVSPQNLFVTVDGVVKVLDFGVSKLLTDATRTRSGVIKGKLPYMAPEQIRGEPLDARADVFALAVCAWEALAGRRLFDRGSDFQIWKAITEEPIPAIASCPPQVEAVIRRALDRDRTRRHASTRELAQDLRAAAGGGMGPIEIAQVVRAYCAERILARAHQVQTAIGETTDAADTLEERRSIVLRNQSVQVARDAASTIDAVPRRRRGRRPLVAAMLVVVLAAAVIAFVALRHSPVPVAAAPIDALRVRDPEIQRELDKADEQIRRANEDLRKAGILR